MAVPISFRKEADEVGKGCLERMFATASMGMVFKLGPGDYRPWVGKNSACHANLNSYSHPEYDEGDGIPVCAVTVLPQKGWKEGRMSKPGQLEYEFVKWLIKESPWKHVWYTRQISQALKQGYIVARTDVPQNVLSSALIATRALNEHKQIAENFGHFTREGINGNLAFLLAMRTVGSPTACRLAGTGPMHYCFGGTVFSWSSFIKGKFTSPSEKNYPEDRRISRVDSLFGTGKNDQKKVEQLYSRTFNKKQTTINPFKKELATTAGVLITTFAKRMKQLEPEIMEVLECQKYL